MGVLGVLDICSCRGGWHFTSGGSGVAGAQLVGLELGIQGVAVVPGDGT